MDALINGIRLHYVQAGQGPVALLLVHGYPFDHALWTPQIEGLADAARLIAPDLRGLGESDAPDQIYTMDRQADDLAALLDALKIEQAVVCGLSMGGYIALAFWRKYAAHVRGLILADTRAGADAPVTRQGRLETAERVKREGTASVVEGMLPRLLAESTRQAHPEVVEFTRAMMARQSPLGVIGALRGMAERPDSTLLLPTITVPTLAVFGDQDALTLAEPEGRMLAEALPRARLVVIANAGHLSNLEQPEAFNAAVREFLSTNYTNLHE